MVSGEFVLAVYVLNQERHFFWLKAASSVFLPALVVRLLAVTVVLDLLLTNVTSSAGSIFLLLLLLLVVRGLH